MNILMISVSAPIKVNGIFKGVVGADVNISSINSTIKSVLEEKKGRFFVIDSNQKLLLYDDESKVGKSTAEVLSNGTSKNDEILSAIKEKKQACTTTTTRMGIVVLPMCRKQRYLMKGRFLFL